MASTATISDVALAAVSLAEALVNTRSRAEQLDQKNTAENIDWDTLPGTALNPDGTIVGTNALPADVKAVIESIQILLNEHYAVFTGTGSGVNNMEVYSKLAKTFPQ